MFRGRRNVHNLNPWLSIALQPRATVRKLLSQPSSVAPIVLGVIGGLAIMPPVVLVCVAAYGQAETLTWKPLLLGLPIGVVLGPLYVLLFGWVYSSTGRTLAGSAKPRATRVAVAWSLVPLIYAFAIGALLGLVTTIQTVDFDQQGIAAAAQISTAAFALGVLGYHWSLFTLCKGLGEVHGFSAWKGWGAMIFGRGLAAVVLIVPAIIMLALYAAIFMPAE